MIPMIPRYANEFRKRELTMKNRLFNWALVAAVLGTGTLAGYGVAALLGLTGGPEQPCLNEAGMHVELVREAWRHATEPGTVGYGTTVIYWNAKAGPSIWMDFSAANKFGGRGRKIIQAEIDPETCAISHSYVYDPFLFDELRGNWGEPTYRPED